MNTSRSRTSHTDETHTGLELLGGPQYELISFVLTALSSSCANISVSRSVSPQNSRGQAPQWSVSANAFITSADFLRQSSGAFEKVLLKVHPFLLHSPN